MVTYYPGVVFSQNQVSRNQTYKRNSAWRLYSLNVQPAQVQRLSLLIIHGLDINLLALRRLILPTGRQAPLDRLKHDIITRAAAALGDSTNACGGFGIGRNYYHEFSHSTLIRKKEPGNIMPSRKLLSKGNGSDVEFGTNFQLNTCKPYCLFLHRYWPRSPGGKNWNGFSGLMTVA